MEGLMEVSPPLLDILKNKNEKVKLYQYNQSLKIFRGERVPVYSSIPIFGSPQGSFFQIM